jgi:uncharacterized damage-inducible protein DinB
VPFNRDAIEELYAFTGYVWDGILSELRRVGPEMFTKPAPGSGWPSFRECLGHNLFGYDRWLAIMKGEPMEGVEPAAIASIDELSVTYKRFRGELRRLLEGSDDAELHRQRDFSVDGEAIRYTLGELLAHLLLHERGHLGDISTLCYQHGIELDVDVEYRFMLGRE